MHAEGLGAARAHIAGCARCCSLFAALHSGNDGSVAPNPRERALTFAVDEMVAGRYRILRFLAQGGMGQVYQAYDQELRIEVALKSILPAISDDERALTRFKREVLLARRVSHPNVCRIFDFGVHQRSRDSATETVHFLTMELLHGPTLAQRLLERGPLSTAQALPLLKQMALALDAAHQQGITHRDFKPENVFLVPREHGEERLVVTDFGLAQARIAHSDGERSLGTKGVLLGTPAYMAPEQVEGAEVGPASDIFALGVVLYEMVTGQRPFVADTALGTALKRLTQAPASPRTHQSNLDAKWEAVILRCLQRRPAERYESAAAVVAALDSSEVAPHHRRWTRFSAVLISYGGFSFGLLQCVDLLVNRYALSAELVKLSLYLILLLLPSVLLFGTLRGEPRHGRLWRMRWVGVATSLAVFVVGTLWIVHSRRSGRSGHPLEPARTTGIVPPVVPRSPPGRPLPPMPNLTAFPCEEKMIRTATGQASIWVPSAGMRPDGPCGRGFSAWCDERQQHMACCTDGLVPFGSEGTCGCPPGGSTKPAAVAAGCAKAPPISDASLKDLIVAVIGRHMMKVKDCYEADLEGNERLQGRVMVRFYIAADGSVSSARIESTSLPAPGAQRCITDLFRTLRFRPPADGFMAVSYPITMHPGTE